MALGNSPCLTPRSRRADDLIERELGCSHWPGLIGRKRVFISNALELPSFTSPPDFSLAKHHNNTSLVGKSRLESLPEDVLVRLLCGVNHEDLKHLVCVSKTIKDAALVAKQLHFAFNTPSKRRLVGVRSFTNLEAENLCDASAPGAPRRAKRLPFEGKKLKDISVALFADLEDA